MLLININSIAAALITVSVYSSLGFKQIKTEEEEEHEKSFKRQNSNLHPEDIKTKKEEVLCVSFTRIGRI